MTTVLLIHGFLDDINVWDDLASALPDDVAVVRYQLPGFGARSDDVPSELTLAALAAEAGRLLDDVDSDVIVVGQSLGTQVAELVAASHAGKVTGLVLITPVPLGGTRLPTKPSSRSGRWVAISLRSAPLARGCPRPSPTHSSTG